MFYERIKELRLALRMNQVEFANKLNITKQCVSNWENGYIQPSVDMLIKIAKTFSVSTDWLLGLCYQDSLDVSGLSTDEIMHLQNIINDLKKYKFM
ncbi:MAG: helix-turn-helix domain-containing protein [Oscillospiraceae bacterium]|nr:helix-turn-helix domain-containing protein [Oscillospiraceae bacterium]MDE6657081.1 helix-turn-helix domain-containing protein [Oscillospiraceae bacterium]